MKENHNKNLLVTIKDWHLNILPNYLEHTHEEWEIISDKDKFNYEFVKEFNPKYIFIPHWSWYIPEEMYSNFVCIGFHESDLPFGKGGSPIQNLISNGLKETKISAFRVTSELDSGDIYMKETLSLIGNAEDIYIRSSHIIGKMIQDIVKTNPTPTKQMGESTYFNRRMPKESEIPEDIESLDKLYDFIRMLDADSYPKAYIRYGKYKLILSRSSRTMNKLDCDVSIIIDDE